MFDYSERLEDVELFFLLNFRKMPAFGVRLLTADLSANAPYSRSATKQRP